MIVFIEGQYYFAFFECNNKRKQILLFFYIMRNRRVLVEIPPNLNESSDDSIYETKGVRKVSNKYNQNIGLSVFSAPQKDKVGYISYIQNYDDSYMQNIQKLVHHQKKFLKYFNAKSLEAVINMYSDLKCRESQLEKKVRLIKEKYKSRIKNLEIQNQSDQQKIELLEKTIDSLHNENDKTILIIESLQNENVVLSEKKVSAQLNNKMLSKTIPVINDYHMLQNSVLLNENQNLKVRCERQETENQKLKIEVQKLEISNQDLKKECQKQETENRNLKIQNQKLQTEINELKVQIDQIRIDKIEELQQAEANYVNSQKIESEKLIHLVNKYKKQNELLNLNKNTLETENKALLTSLSHQSFLKNAIKSLKHQNFKLEVEVENLKMKNFKSPFQSPPRPSQNDNDMIDIGIITSFSENNLNPIESQIDNIDFQKLYFIEKERRRLLAILLSKIIKMIDEKCNQLLYDYSIIMNSNNTRIQKIITLIRDLYLNRILSDGEI
ncbi:hypothetical protein M9Y10_043673 [Tritrichomonas musculus]|uniref:GRIP domain-containing protein n=1 Tax=Tritrichomonas musculus TaxID=1915356 RepID=A0ABR2K0H6_9EUKA